MANLVFNRTIWNRNLVFIADNRSVYEQHQSIKIKEIHSNKILKSMYNYEGKNGISKINSRFKLKTKYNVQFLVENINWQSSNASISFLLSLRPHRLKKLRYSQDGTSFYASFLTVLLTFINGVTNLMLSDRFYIINNSEKIQKVQPVQKYWLLLQFFFSFPVKLSKIGNL